MGAGKKLQAGQFELNTRMSMSEIFRLLQKGGKSNEANITIPEGFTLEQITLLLNEKSIIPPDRFHIAVYDKKFLERENIQRNTVEGYLFPDTYHLFFNISGDRVVDMMLNRFEEVAVPIYNKYANKTKLTLDQAIILASIIEKEALSVSDMRTISSVFHNRLKRGMPLQSEPTVRYAVKKFSQVLTVDDLKSTSPYNTYRYNGLPIGPICNPGAAALESALNPDNSKFLYFVSNSDGSHAFSYTLSEHNIAVAKYKKSIQLNNDSTFNQIEDNFEQATTSLKTKHL